MSRRRRSEGESSEPQTIKDVRSQLLRSLAAVLSAAERRAGSDGEGDAEAALLYAQAAQALMAGELAKELCIGKEGLGKITT